MRLQICNHESAICNWSFPMPQYRFHVMDIVDDYLHDLLDSDQIDYLELHCRECRICEAALAEARKRQAIVEGVPTCEASTELIDKTLESIDVRDRSDRKRRKYIFRVMVSAVAASILVLGGMHLYYLNLSANPVALTVLGQNQLLAGTTGSLRIFLNKGSQGVAGATVKVELRDSQGRVAELGTFKTDDQGTGQPRLKLPDWEDGDYTLRVVANSGWFESEELTEKIRLKRSWKLLLTSDKPVYQPGQQIRVRSLALRRPDLKPVAAREVTFAITDPKGNVVFKRNDVTSKFGIASIDCPLASEIIEGPYTIACKVGDTESKLLVDVKKYVLPKFKIDLHLEQPFYQPGQRVRGKLQADYFYAKPVADAQVALIIENLNGLAKIVPDIKSTTDAMGHFPFEFVLPESLAGSGQEGVRIGVQATVTDSAGQKETRSTTSVVSTEVLRVEVMPEAGTLVPGVANTVYVFVSYPDGQPVAKAEVQVSGQDKELVTNELGVASFVLKPQEGVAMSRTVKATDGKGQVGRKQVQLDSEKITGNFLFRTDKAVYQSGDTVHVSAVGDGIEPIFVDFIKDGQTMLTEAIPMAKGKGTFSFDLPADLAGTMEMVAYRLTAGSVVRKSRALYIHQAKQIGIAASCDHKEYRPGSQAKLHVKLTDAHGKAVAGAVSLSAVDEAVYAVLPQRPGLEGTFYNLEQKLLKPIYEIYPWSPALGESRGDPEARRLLEQALFARTARVETTELAALPTGAQKWPLKVQNTMLTRNAQIKGKAHTLANSNLPVKVDAAERSREDGLSRVKTGWIVFFVVLALAFSVHLLVAWKPWVGVQNFFESLEAPSPSQDLDRPSWVPSSVGCATFLMFAFVVCLMGIQIIGRNANSAFGTVGASIGATVSGGLGWSFTDRTEKSAPSGTGTGTGSGTGTGMALDTDDLRDIAALKTKPMSQDQNVEVGDEPAAPARLREYFPETLLWKPQLITDEQGEASLDIDLADSITTWRLSASAVTADGRLGAASDAIKVFQPFFVDVNLPVSLTRGDEVSMPVIVSSYLSRPQTVTIELKPADWYELLEGERATRTLELKPDEKIAVKFPIKINKVGPQQALTVEGRGVQMSDAVKRVVEVVPDGQKVERVVNGSLNSPVDLKLQLPTGAIEGSPKLFLKIYPSNFSQLVEGLDNIFRMPSGCFEQTSSTTYPNILALDYLRRTDKSVPAVETKARQFIHLGYQRLLTFEVAGGGFDWFGRPPANRTLTAYGLMEFVDMAKVHDVDPQLIERTRDWLLRQRNADGSWAAEGHEIHDGPGSRGAELAQYSTTAYIGWAVFDGRSFDRRSAQTREFLLRRAPDRIGDPYVLALACNTLLAIDGTGATPYIDALQAERRTSADGKQVWWEQPAGRRTCFYGAGRSGDIETTALAALALIKAGQHAASARGALTWLAQQKDGNGTWFSTQATVLALKALVAGTGKSLDDGQGREIEITLSENAKRKIFIPASQAEVMQQIDLSSQLKPGDNRLTIKETTGTGAGYQVAFRYHVAAPKPADKQEPLAIDVVYDRTELAVNETIKATATVRNQMSETAPMVMLDLPVPAGFSLVPDSMNKMVEAGTIARYQLTGRSVLIYLRGLEAGKSLELEYQMRATLPVKVSVAPARAYEYYDPAKHGQSQAAKLTVTAR
jgi:uncharacterized protein YfaS (alpha-2-macroglobulin family)